MFQRSGAGHEVESDSTPGLNQNSCFLEFSMPFSNPNPAFCDSKLQPRQYVRALRTIPSPIRLRDSNPD